MIKSLLSEYGLKWIVYRLLYSLKLRLMRMAPFVERIFEKEVQVNRVDIFDIDIKKIEFFLNDISKEHRREIVGLADDAIKGKILGFSSVKLDYGSPINWHLNPLTGVETDKTVKWYNIPDFDPITGDVKVIWEASRFTHFFLFSRAFMITKEKKYYDAFSNHLDGWLQNNKYSYGVNYKCGQEATIRMMNALINYSVFSSYGLATGSDLANIRKLVRDSYKKVRSNFFYAHKCIKNNHTLSEITGLIIGAWCCKDGRRLRKAYELLEKEIEAQFMSDGVYLQYSFNYQRFALQILLFILKISRQTKLCISEKSKSLIIKSAILMYQLQDDSGDVPNYGSNDGALIFPVTSCDYRDFRSTINAVYAKLKKKRLYGSGLYDEELLWFGDTIIRDLPVENTKRVSTAFEASGLYSFRNDYGFLMVVLQRLRTRPAQMDQLHIDIWHKGVNVLCDSGTYSYASDIGKNLSLTAAHNTIKVDNKEQMNKHGPFLIYGWTQTDDVKYSGARFTGTVCSVNNYRHTRNISATTTGYLVEDHVIGDGFHCRFNFRTPCEVRILGSELELVSNGAVIARCETNGVINVEKVNRSLYYYQKEEINMVSISRKMINGQCSIQFDMQLL